MRHRNLVGGAIEPIENEVIDIEICNGIKTFHQRNHAGRSLRAF